MEMAPPTSTEFLVSTLLGVFFFAATCGLAMMYYRWERHDAVKHLSGVGAIVCFTVVISIALMLLLGFLGMTRVQAIGVPLGLCIAALTGFWPEIDRFAGYRPNGGVTPSPIPTAGHPVLLHMTYDGAFHVFNDGVANLEIWGTQMSNGPRSIEGQRRIIAPHTEYFIRDDGIHAEILRKVPRGHSAKTGMTLFLRDDAGEDYIARFILVIHNASPKPLVIDTQMTDLVREKWSEQPAVRNERAAVTSLRAQAVTVATDLSNFLASRDASDPKQADGGPAFGHPEWQAYMSRLAAYDAETMFIGAKYVKAARRVRDALVEQGISDSTLDEALGVAMLAPAQLRIVADRLRIIGDVG